MKDYIEKIKSIFERALAGEIKYDDFLLEWENIDDGSSISQVLFEDLAEGIGHCPGHFNRPGIDIETWERQKEFLVLKCDTFLLKYIDSHRDTWLKSREEILNNIENIDVKRLPKIIESIFS